MLGGMGCDESIRATVERLCTPPWRRTGTDAERRAAGWLGERLRQGGSKVEIEPTYVHPQWATTYLLHCVVAIAGSLAATGAPAVGFALVLAAATSLYLDLSGRRYLLRRLFFRRASQNVISPPLDDSEGPRVIICANYDTGVTGAAYNPWALGTFERLRRLLPVRTAPMAIVFWTIALLLPPLGLRLAGIEDDWVAFLQLPQTLLLIAAGFMLGEIALSPPSPGANANASGVAAALEAARRLEQRPPERLRVHVMLDGAGEAGGEGLRWFLRNGRQRLPRDRTWVIALEEAGRGTPRYVAREVPALAQAADASLLGLCEALAEGSPERSRLDLGPAGGASLAANQGYPAIAITAREASEFVPAGHHTPRDLPERVDEGAVEAVAAFAADLVALLDRDAARRLSS
jgi:hypothetical protein